MVLGICNVDGKAKDVIAMATETYPTRKGCILSIGFLQKYGPDAGIRL